MPPTSPDRAAAGEPGPRRNPAGPARAALSTLPTSSQEPPPALCRWRIVKLGGSSMASTRALGGAVRHLVTEAQGRPVAVVVSALGGTTDRLLDALEAPRETAGPVVEELRRRHLDHLQALASPEHAEAAARRLARHLARLRGLLESARRPGEGWRAEVLATGERLAAEVMLAACHSAHGATTVRVAPLDPGELLVAGGPRLDAEIDLQATVRADLHAFPAGHLWVMPGFFARGRDRRLRLLGRGGSDTSATLLGRILDADRVEIWTDVDGVFPRDPRRHPGLLPFAHLSYDEAERLAAAGARVLHAKSVAPARASGLPILVRNSFRPEVAGTWITAAAPGREAMPVIVGARPLAPGTLLAANEDVPALEVAP